MLELELLIEDLRMAIAKDEMGYTGFVRNVQRLMVLSERMAQELRHIRQTNSAERVLEE